MGNTATAARWPVGLLGALALLAGVETAVARHGDDLASFIASSWRESGRRAREIGAGREVEGGVLCLGDSQIKCGLLPRLIGDRLGVPAVNLAVIGGQAPSTFAMLERALRGGSRPRAVVLDYYPGLLASDLTINTRNWAELLGVGECAGLIQGARDGRLAAPILLRAALPTLRARDELRALMVAAARGEPDVKRDEARAYRRNWRVNGGAHALAVKPGDDDAAIEPPAVSPEAARRWAPKPVNVRYVRRALALARQRGIRVYWLLPTYAPGLQAVRARDALGASHARFVQAMRAEFPGLTVLDPSTAISDPSRFSDPCHVNRRGAVALSLAVAEAIARPEGERGGRVALAGPDPRLVASREAAIEDVGQSAEEAGPGRSGVAPRVAAGPSAVGRR